MSSRSFQKNTGVRKRCRVAQEAAVRQALGRARCPGLCGALLGVPASRLWLPRYLQGGTGGARQPAGAGLAMQPPG